MNWFIGLPVWKRRRFALIGLVVFLAGVLILAAIFL